MYYADSIFKGLLGILFLAAYIMAFEFPEGAREYPQYVSLIGCILCIVAAVSSAWKKWRARKCSPSPKDEEGTPVNKFRMCVFFAALTAYVLLVPVIGFYTCTAVYLVSLMTYLKRPIKLYYFIVAAVFLGFVYLVFGQFLHIQMPRGILF